MLFVLIDRSEGRKVVLGAHSLSEPEDSKQTFDIVQVFSHPDFSISNYDNDIALVKVSHTPVLSLSLSSVSVPFNCQVNSTQIQQFMYMV